MHFQSFFSTELFVLRIIKKKKKYTPTQRHRISFFGCYMLICAWPASQPSQPQRSTSRIYSLVYFCATHTQTYLYLTYVKQNKDQIRSLFEYFADMCHHNVVLPPRRRRRQPFIAKGRLLKKYLIHFLKYFSYDLYLLSVVKYLTKN